jgi:hypothetical protein
LRRTLRPPPALHIQAVRFRHGTARAADVCCNAATAHCSAGVWARAERLALCSGARLCSATARQPKRKARPADAVARSVLCCVLHGVD